MKVSLTIIAIFSVLFTTDCRRKKTFNEDIEDCDAIGNYYENGSHYVNRDILTDEGVLDYKKMFDRYKGKDTACHPDRLINYK
jgi:hypothetical protein